MLRIFNDLDCFFEDCYMEIGVREYARLKNISPPTASKLLASLEKEGLLLMEEERRTHLYRANRENKDFIALSRIYWQQKLEPLTKYLADLFVLPTIILFGSLSKAEVTKESDIDIVVLAHKRKVDFTYLEKKLGRPVQILVFRSVSEMSRELASNVLNGLVLHGRVWIGERVVIK